MAKDRDYYEVLGVPRGASEEELRTAYRKLARQHHPDVSEADDAVERFAEVTAAYEVLSDPERRKKYDRFGRAGVAGTAGGGGWPPGGASPGGPGFDPGDIGSIFEEMFGREAGGPSGPFGRPGRGRDLEHELTVTFMSAARGSLERLRLNLPGNGATRTVKVRIPPGVETGARLRVKSAGQPAPPGGQPGDLILVVTVGGHPHFRRDGLNLLVDVPVTLVEAALGTRVQVPLLAGTAEVKIPAGANSGQKLRLAGKGITDETGRRGDLFAVIQIVAPETLSDRARELLEALGEELKNPRDSGPWADTRSASSG